MLSLTGFKIRFILNWPMAILTLAAILIFMRLGYWQLERAHEKEQMLQLEKKFLNQLPMDWSPLDKPPAQYQRIKVRGHFLSQVVLLDNQHHQHQFGYHVLSPFQLTNHQIILVDRGWVAGDVTRQSLPVIKTPLSIIEIIGSSYYPSEKKILLGQPFEKKENQLIIESIDTKIASQFLHKSVHPFIIRLDKKEANGFIREWPIVSMSPQRHYAYAFQWFAIAFVIFVLFVALNSKKKA
ncbi:SURF1 family protein [Legionella nagasakiensis]|uniref:SURF1 family protein n=1 Tax=Legionella nagasakiensis TaxID=535290 RepID=UPI00105531F0|nr:SURF1 family protein [Legionella nagasakiensis]